MYRVDKNYCMSHYLAFRFIKDENINFFKGLKHKVFKPKIDGVVSVDNIQDMDKIIKDKINSFFIPNKTAIFLSGGIDSAILASHLPKGTAAYTFKCVAEGAIDETSQAKKYCDLYELNHKIIEMYWDDFENLTPEILKYNGVPFHSIEVQLVKAAKQMKLDGIERVIIGESADLIFGGMDQLISKDWGFDEFYARYNFTEPSSVLKEYVDVHDFYENYRLHGNKIDFLRFMDEVFSIESSTSYMHAFNKEGIQYLDPYSYMKMAKPLDLYRIRNGEPKYMVRELFKYRYPSLDIPSKIPMPRAMNQWMKNYKPSRDEFLEGCEQGLSGDQKWQLYCLERFLNIYDNGEL